MITTANSLTGHLTVTMTTEDAQAILNATQNTMIPLQGDSLVFFNLLDGLRRTIQ